VTTIYGLPFVLLAMQGKHGSYALTDVYLGDGV